MTDKKQDNKLRKYVTGHLAAERMMQKKSQEEMAQALGTSKSAISRIESGKQNITVDYIQAIAEYLNKDVLLVMEDHKIEYGETAEYSLKLYDEELIRFEMSRKGERPIKIISVKEERKAVFPPDLEVSGEGLLRWLEKRSIPKNRDKVGEILFALGLEINDFKGFIDICMGLSLNDSYWVPQATFEGSFSEYNLFENRFDEALSLIAYTGYGNKLKSIGTTPELTTGGMLRKSWHYSTTKGIWLYKGGTEGFANAGLEPYSEFLASQIANTMRLHAVNYELQNWHSILASKCKLFTDIDTSYVPIGRIVRTGGIDACIDFYKELGDDFYQELASMLVFDAVVMNEDRHFGNFGLLRDNHTGEYKSPAPIFDNGISLLCYAMKIDFDDDEKLSRYIQSRRNPYGRDNSFTELARKVMGSEQRKQLRRLIGFQFEESDVTNLPSWRTHKLEEIVQERVKELLAE